MVVRAVAWFLLWVAFLFDWLLIGSGIINVMVGKSFLQGIIEILEHGWTSLIALLGSSVVAGMFTYKFIKNEKDKKS